MIATGKHFVNVCAEYCGAELVPVRGAPSPLFVPSAASPRPAAVPRRPNRAAGEKPSRAPWIRVAARQGGLENDDHLMAGVDETTTACSGILARMWA